jgi:hypothetical protein
MKHGTIDHRHDETLRASHSQLSLKVRGLVQHRDHGLFAILDQPATPNKEPLSGLSEAHSHTTFVPANTIGNPMASDKPVTTEKTDQYIVAYRWVENSAPTPNDRRRVDFADGKVDRGQYFYFHLPSMSRVEIIVLPAGTERTRSRPRSCHGGAHAAANDRSRKLRSHGVDLHGDHQVMLVPVLDQHPVAPIAHCLLPAVHHRQPSNGAPRVGYRRGAQTTQINSLQTRAAERHAGKLRANAPSALHQCLERYRLTGRKDAFKFRSPYSVANVEQFQAIPVRCDRHEPIREDHGGP